MKKTELTKKRVPRDFPPSGQAREFLSDELEKARRREHEAKFEKDWIHYLRQRERGFIATLPTEYARFLLARTRNLKYSRNFKDEAEVEACMANEEERLKDFQRRFLKFLPDFWEWDQTLNPKRFKWLNALIY